MQSSGEYTGIENANTGKILSYIGLALAGIYLLLDILYFGVIAAIIFAAVSDAGMN